MGLFKKDEEVPAVPQSRIPELPESGEVKKKELPGLPAFPANTNNENINQQMVKSAISEMPSPSSELAPKMTQATQPVSSVEIGTPGQLPELPPIPTASQTSNQVRPTVPQTSLQSAPQPRSSLNEPIFIRLDKYQSSQKSVDAIREKVAKMEATLKKIEETKAKEEDELKGWIENINHVKTKIAEVDRDIFNQI
jgi:hypothetical protein